MQTKKLKLMREKSVCIRSFSGPHFPAMRRDTNYHKFQWKTSVLESLFGKVSGPATLLKRDSSAGVFP